MRNRLIFFLGLIVTGAMLITVHQIQSASEQGRTIPQHSIFATFTQEPTMAVEDVVDPAVLAEALVGDRESQPKVALCLGTDVTSAVKASANAFAMPESSAAIVQPDSNNELWIAAYFGADGSLPPAYQVQSVKVTDRTIRVTYTRDASAGRSCDLREYMIWAPLGQVEPGQYSVELFEATSEQITARRDWQIK